MPKVIELRKEAIGQLNMADIGSARLDVDLLLEKALGLSALDIILEPDRDVSEGDAEKFHHLLKRRLSREPVSQILGRKDFWSLSFKVTGDCLTPRPDSETLIEAALKHIPDRTAPLKILDMGTGSGCLILSLMSELPNSRGVAVDISEKALLLAQENADNLGFGKRCRFILSDWATGLVQGEKFDIILCNPPYISTEEARDLDPDVRDFEPHQALFADDGGIREYKRLAEIIPGLINPGGNVFLEIGHRQGPTVVNIFANCGMRAIQVIPDLAARDRCVALFY